LWFLFYSIRPTDLLALALCSQGNGGEEQLSSITNNGCFEPGAQFNLWVDADAATKSYMANYAFTIDPTVRRQGRAKLVCCS
jgi:hypothetical protein